MTTPLISVQNLSVHFQIKKKTLRSPAKILKAVNGVSFEVAPGETLGIVGESGCGKSTLARAILKFVDVAEGEVLWENTDLAKLNKNEMRPYRKDIQVVFQSPLASLNPRMTIGNIIMEPLEVFESALSREEKLSKMRDIMRLVGLNPNMANRYPNEFSGGQCQRVSIARAMILNPRLIICDEAVSALDVSIKAQIINLLRKLQRETGVSIIFISHDLSIVRQISHRVMVMYLGKIMEISSASEIFGTPRHPYTKVLLEAIPRPDPAYERTKNITVLDGDIPSPISPPSGCVFRTRCPLSNPKCIKSVPKLEETESGHKVACLFVERVPSHHSTENA